MYVHLPPIPHVFTRLHMSGMSFNDMLASLMSGGHGSFIALMSFILCFEWNSWKEPALHAESLLMTVFLFIKFSLNDLLSTVFTELLGVKYVLS